MIFTVGNIYKLSSIWAMPNVNFSIDNREDRICRATWDQNGKVFCSVCFPVNYNLYHGTDLVENQRRLLDDLRRVSVIQPKVDRAISKDKLVKLFEPNYFVLKGDSFYVATLNSNNYYVQEGNEQYKLLFSDRHPVESFANLLTACNRLYCRILCIPDWHTYHNRKPWSWICWRINRCTCICSNYCRNYCQE